MRAGRYALQGVIGKGGAATVHLAKLSAEGDFERIVAVKRLHPDVARDERARAAFVDEAKLASRIRSAHVVPTLDVVEDEDELFVVMEYVAGETLSRLIIGAARDENDLPLASVVAILGDILRGLRAAHEATAPDGTPLGLVHRDVSPQNILVGADGSARLLDFGIAKAIGRSHRTRTGMVKGKLGYMPPEQLRGEPVDARADLYALGVVAFEALTAERLFPGDEEGVVDRILRGDAEPPSARRSDVTAEIDAVVMRALRTDPGDRFANAAEMLAALEAASPRATTTEVADLVRRIACTSLAERAELVAECERTFVETTTLVAPVKAAAPSPPPAPSRRRRATLVALATGVLAIVIGAALLATRRPAKVADAPSAAEPSAEPSQTVPLASDHDPDPPPAPNPGTVNTPRPSTKPAARPSKCSPPYVIDSEGHKRWKRECF